MVKNSVLNSWTGIVIRIRAKIKWFVASETSHPPKIQNSTSTTSGIISKIRTVAPYHAAVKNYWIRIVDPSRLHGGWPDPRVGSGWVRKCIRTHGSGREVAEKVRRSGGVAAGQVVALKLVILPLDEGL